MASPRTEFEFKKRLEKLSDFKIKNMIERVDVHPFPVILLQEYTRRFGKDVKKQTSLILRQLKKEKLAQKKLLGEIKNEAEKMKDYTISQTGIRGLSKKAIDSIHQRSKSTVYKIKRTVESLEETNKKIVMYEDLIKSLQR